MDQRSRENIDKETTGNTATFLLTKKPQENVPIEDHRIKIVIIGSGNTGVAVAIAILFKRLTSELILIDRNENLAKAEAEDIGHVAAFLGNPKILGTKDYSLARDATICVITVCAGTEKGHPSKSSLLADNLEIFKSIIAKICKFAPNCILVVATHPVDILSYAAMKFSGFPANRVIGVGTFLDSCRFQYFIARKLGISANSVQAFVIGENGPTSVPVWSMVNVMGLKIKDINKNIGGHSDPEDWSDLHDKVIHSNIDITRKKGCCNWGLGICTSEIVDAIIRNTCVCITVSTFVQGCRHGLEKDVFMSLPCIVGRNGVQSYVRQIYTKEEQELMLKSCQKIYETQKNILDQFD